LSILYIGNATSQPRIFFYRDTGGGGPARLSVPPNSVAQTPDMPTGLIDAIAAQLSPYLGPWSGSGVGYSIDAPITL
jgi:hypothetical protein